MIATTRYKPRSITNTATGDEHTDTGYHDNAGTAATGDTVVILNPIYLINELMDELADDLKKFEDLLKSTPKFTMPDYPDSRPVSDIIRKTKPAGKFLPYILNRRAMFPKSGFVKMAKRWR